MTHSHETADATADRILVDLDSYIGEFEARGWLKAATIAEDLVCTIYAKLGREVPKERAAQIEAMLSQDLTRLSDS